MDEELIVLYDEEGNEQSFAYLDTIEMNGASYLALTPVYEDEEEDSEDTEVVFMKLTHDEENPNEDMLLIVEDDAELDQVFSEFMRRVEEEE